MQRSFDLYVVRNLGEINQAALATLFRFRKSLCCFVVLPLCVLAFWGLHTLIEMKNIPWEDRWQMIFWLYPIPLLWLQVTVTLSTLLLRWKQNRADVAEGIVPKSAYRINHFFGDVASVLLHMVLMAVIVWVPILNLFSPVVALSLAIHLLRNQELDFVKAFSKAWKAMKRNAGTFWGLLLMGAILVWNSFILYWEVRGFLALTSNSLFLEEEINWLIQHEYYSSFLLALGVGVAQALFCFWALAFVFFAGRLIEGEEQRKLLRRIQDF